MIRYGTIRYKESVCLGRLIIYQSSLICNTSARHEQLKCDMSDISEARTTRVQHKRYANDTRATQVNNFDFNNVISHSSSLA